MRRAVASKGDWNRTYVTKLIKVIIPHLRKPGNIRRQYDRLKEDYKEYCIRTHTHLGELRVDVERVVVPAEAAKKGR